MTRPIPTVIATLACLLPCGATQAGLIGSTVAYNGHAAVVGDPGIEFSNIEDNNGTLFSADFTGNSVALTIGHQIPGLPLLALGTFSFRFTFAQAVLASVGYIGGTVAPPHADPCAPFQTLPDTFCTGLVDVAAPLNYVTAHVNAPGTLDITVSSYSSLSAFDTVILSLGAADPIPEPATAALLGLGLAGLFTRRRLPG